MLDQSYSRFELIIVDDGSSDSTIDYLEDLEARDSRIRFLTNQDNIGACRSRNRAIDAARGTLITGLDDDDYFLPSRLETLTQLWKGKKPKTVAVTSSRYRVGPGNSIKFHPGQRLITKRDIYLRNIVGSQILLPTQLARSIGGYDPSMLAWQDYEYILRVLSHGNIESATEATYIVDASHNHERISTSKFENVHNSCERLINKHQLTGRDALRVKSQLLVYRFRYLTALKQAILFTMYRDIAGLKAIIMRWTRSNHKLNRRKL